MPLTAQNVNIPSILQQRCNVPAILPVAALQRYYIVRVFCAMYGATLRISWLLLRNNIATEEIRSDVSRRSEEHRDSQENAGCGTPTANRRASYLRSTESASRLVEQRKMKINHKGGQGRYWQWAVPRRMCLVSEKENSALLSFYKIRSFFLCWRKCTY